jgi:hypothetical protein
MERRAVVLDVGSRYLTVLVQGGEVRRVRRPRGPVQPGQEIWVPGESPREWRWWIPAVAAAVVVAAVVGGRAVAPPPTAAVVLSVDINPSLDLGVSAAGRVVTVTPFDAAARSIVRDLPPLAGRPLAQAITAVVDAAHRAGYLRGPTSPGGGYLLLAAAPQESGGTRLTGVTLAEAASIVRTATRGWSVRLVVLPAATPGTLSASLDRHLSLGRYLLANRTHTGWRLAAGESLAQLLAGPRHNSRARGLAHRSRPARSASAPPSQAPAAPSTGSGQPAPNSRPAGTTVAGTLTAVQAARVTVGNRALQSGNVGARHRVSRRLDARRRRASGAHCRGTCGGGVAACQNGLRSGAVDALGAVVKGMARDGAHQVESGEGRHGHQE